MTAILALWIVLALVVALAFGWFVRQADLERARADALRQLRAPIRPLPRVLRFVSPHSTTAARGPIRRTWPTDGDAA